MADDKSLDQLAALPTRLQSGDSFYVTRAGTDYEADADDVTKDTVGLGNVDNTSDADKPVSSATQTALDAKAATNRKLDDFGAPDDNTDLNASTTAHGLLLKATAPAAGLRNVVAIDNGEAAYKNAALFDATNPADLGTAAPGSAMAAARRDHVHAMPTFAQIGAGVLAASITLGENFGLIYDAALSADGKYSGIVRAGTAGATLAFGDLIYLAAADSRWELADADAASTSGDVMLGMCVLAAASDGDPTTVLMMGFIRADTAFPALTIGAPAYVGTTPGDIQTAAPTGTDDVIRRVGFAWTADELYFNPSNDYATHTG